MIQLTLRVQSEEDGPRPMTRPDSAPRIYWPCTSAASPVERLVAQVEQDAVMEACWRLHLGSCPPPKVYMFIDDWDPPVVSAISTRPYYRGADAAAAIAHLGAMPASIMATRLLLVWDEYDLRTSLYGDGDHARGLVAVHATFTGHLLHWYPYTLAIEDPERGLSSIQITWDEPLAHPDAPLPDPILRILQCWHQLAEPDPQVVIPRLEAEGYVVTSFAP